jgi:ubiquinone/menaquinone biosynthesis C-methylase UbiE
MAKIYPFGYNDAAVGMMQTRTAEACAGLFLKHAAAGMRVLDVGCGPGSITFGLAQALAPGKVTGIDFEASQISIAEQLVKRKQQHNCDFKVASVYELPFADAEFDAVYGHTILMQFKDLHPVLAEIRRVLKPGGLISFREVDFGANLYYPQDSAYKKLMTIFRKSIAHNQGNPDIGRSLASSLSDAGFSIQETFVSYAQAPTDEARKVRYGEVTALWEQADFPRQAVALGWITDEERIGLPDRLKQESVQPGIINGTTYVEIVGKKTY